MIKTFQKIILGLSFIVFVAAPVATVVSPVAPIASAASCSPRFLGIPAWYRGLTVAEDGDAETCAKLKSPADMTSGDGDGGIGAYIGIIVLNLIEAGLVIVGYIAVALIIYGGFLFVTGGGNPGQIEKARKSILNASIGLLISIASIAITNFIFGVLG